jgi:type I restriction enzyme S subunit
LVESELGPIPTGWDLEAIGDRFRVVVGSTPSRKRPDYWGGDVHWVNSGASRQVRVLTGTEMITTQGLASTSTKMMPVGTAITAVTGATLGEVSRLEIEACGSQNVCGVYDASGELDEFTYLALQAEISRIVMKAHGGAQQHINKAIVAESKVLMPPHQLTDRLQNTVRPVYRLLVTLLRQVESLREARDFLLPKLVSGEVDVSDLDIDVGDAA